METRVLSLFPFCLHGFDFDSCEYRNTFQRYAYLWNDDRAEVLRTFLKYGHIPSPEEIEAAGEEGVPEQKPTLEQFKAQVGHVLRLENISAKPQKSDLY